MRHLVCLIACIAAFGSAFAEEIVRDPKVMAFSWGLLMSEHLGFSVREQAAFVVRETSGEITFVRWPYNADVERARYRGTAPRGSVAIVHTHPNSRPMPSDDDVVVARRLGIPVYVITRMRITRTDGTHVETIALGDWNPER